MRRAGLLVILFSLSSCDFVFESQGSGQFHFSNQVTQLNNQRAEQAIDSLFAKTTNCDKTPGCLTSERRRKILNNVLNLKQKHDSLIQEVFVQNAGQMKFAYQTYAAAQSKITKIQFPSFYQRPGNHPANQVHGWFLTPKYLENCSTKLPTVYILHHLDNDIDPEMQMSQVLLQLGQRINTFVLFLPHYGPRHFGDEDFLVPHYEKLRENFFQAALDVRLGYEWLKENPRVDARHITLYGLSLGSIVGVLAAGFDNSFSKYSFLGTGGDLAKIIFTNIQKDPDDLLSRRFAQAQWNESDARLNLAAVDPIVWAQAPQNARIQMFYSPNDELMGLDGIEKIRDQFQISNQVTLYPYSGGHRPQVETWLEKISMFKQLFWPLYNFAIDGTATPPTQCGRPFKPGIHP